MAGDLRRLHLDIYDTGAGLWNPEHGLVEVPPDWDFLPSGDRALTGEVKAAGVYWTAWRPKSRHRPRRRRLGLWAPKTAIDEARIAATPAPEKQHDHGHERRRQDRQFREDMAAAVVDFLDFAPEHAGLAARIAAEAAARAERSRKLGVADQAPLAARTTIRHQYTDYDDTLAALTVSDFWDDDALHREAKSHSHGDVDAFLAEHRRRR